MTPAKKTDQLSIQHTISGMATLTQRINGIDKDIGEIQQAHKEALIRVSGLELWKAKVEDLIRVQPGGDAAITRDNSKYNWAAIIISALTAIGLIAQAIK